MMDYDLEQDTERSLSEAKEHLRKAIAHLGWKNSDDLGQARDQLEAAEVALSRTARLAGYADGGFWERMYHAATFQRPGMGEDLHVAGEYLLANLLQLEGGLFPEQAPMKCATDQVDCDQPGLYLDLDAFGYLCKEHRREGPGGDA